MRHIAPIVMLLSACLASNANAADPSTNPCALLDWQDLQTLGATKDTPMADAGWHPEKIPNEIPDSQLFTNMCAITIPSKAGRSSVSLSFDSFTGKATEQQVSDWLKTVSREKEEDTSIIEVGDATCETGTYDLPTRQSDDSVADISEHYIACDKQVGTQHVSLNIHVPEGDKALLLSPEQAKGLLDKAVAKMKETAFAPPENII